MSTTARKFLATTDSVDFGPTTLLAGAFGFALSIWLKFDAGTTFSGLADGDYQIVGQTAGTGPSQTFVLLVHMVGGVPTLNLQLTDGTHYQTWHAATFPFAADGAWHHCAIDWSQQGTTGTGGGPIKVDYDGAAVTMIRDLNQAVLTLNLTPTAHLVVGGDAFPTLPNWSFADFGLYNLPVAGPTQFVFSAGDIANLAAGYPAEVIQATGSPLPMLDVVPITGASPELGILGALSGAIVGSPSVVTGPPTFPPYAATAAFAPRAIAHRPGSLTLNFTWQGLRAPTSPVVFTPTTGAGTFSPPTVTLGASGGATTFTTLTVTGASLGSHPTSISNAISLLPITLPLSVSAPLAEIKAGDPIISPCGEILWLRTVQAADHVTPQPITSAVAGASSITVDRTWRGAGTLTVPLNVADRPLVFDGLEHWASYALVKQKYLIVDEVDAGCTLGGGGTWTAAATDTFHTVYGGSLKYNGHAAAQGVYTVTLPYTTTDVNGGRWQAYAMRRDVYQAQAYGYALNGPYLRLNPTANAQVVITDGVTSQTVPVDQTTEGTYDISRMRHQWTKVGAPFTAANATITLTLTKTAGTANLMADAYLFVYLPTVPALPGDTVVFNADDNHAGTAIDTLGSSINAPVAFWTDADLMPFNSSIASTMKVGFNQAIQKFDGPGRMFADYMEAADFWRPIGGATITEDANFRLTGISAGGSAIIQVCGSFQQPERAGPPADGGNGSDYWAYRNQQRTGAWRLEYTTAGNPGIELTGDGFAVTNSPAGVHVGAGPYTPTPSYAPFPNYTNALYATVTSQGATTDVPLGLKVFGPEIPGGWAHRTHPKKFDRLAGKGFGSARFMNSFGTNNGIIVDAADLPRDGKVPQNANVRHVANVVAVDPVNAASYGIRRARRAWVQITTDGWVPQEGSPFEWTVPVGGSGADNGPWRDTGNGATGCGMGGLKIAWNPNPGAHTFWAILESDNTSTSPSGTPITLSAPVTLLSPTPVTVSQSVGTGISVEAQADFIAELGLDGHFNVPGAANSACVTSMGSTILARTPAGHLHHYEVGNENWQTGGVVPYFYCETQSDHLGLGNNAAVASGYLSAQAFAVLKPLYVAAGRGSEFVPCLNVSPAGAAGELAGMIAAGVVPDVTYPNLHAMVNGYVENDGAAQYGIVRGYDVANTFYSCMSPSGLVSLFALHVVQQYQRHWDVVAGVKASAVAAGFTQIKMRSYEAGLENACPYYWVPDDGILAAQLCLRHPRAYRLTLAWLQSMQVPYANSEIVIFTDDDFQGFIPFNWVTWYDMFEANGTGNPAENQAGGGSDLTALLSQTGGAYEYFASLTGAPPPPSPAGAASLLSCV